MFFLRTSVGKSYEYIFELFDKMIQHLVHSLFQNIVITLWVFYYNPTQSK